MHNSYNILDFDCNSKETGPVYPQIQKMSNGYDNKADNSVKKLFRYSKSFPDFKPNLDSFVLETKSKQTDILSNALSSKGIILNRKTKAIFESVKTCPIQFYEASVTHNNKLLDDYFWMHIVSDYTDFVDYTNSTFFIYQNFMKNLGNIKILSKEDLTEKEEKLKRDNPNTTLAIWSEKIKMLPSFDIKLQLFTIGKFDANLYIGQSLRNILMENKITGYKAENTNKILI
jgi:hypothetical protein